MNPSISMQSASFAFSGVCKIMKYFNNYHEKCCRNMNLAGKAKGQDFIII
jgi:hypothetical protein